MTSLGKRKTVTRRFIERTLKGEWLGFESHAWAAQRITGFIILGFLIVHLYTLSSITGRKAAFEQVMKSMQGPIIKIGELILLWILFLHSLNGFRLLLVNLMPGINHKKLAYSVAIISLILVFISIPTIL